MTPEEKARWTGNYRAWRRTQRRQEVACDRWTRGMCRGYESGTCPFNHDQENCGIASRAVHEVARAYRNGATLMRIPPETWSTRETGWEVWTSTSWWSWKDSGAHQGWRDAEGCAFE